MSSYSLNLADGSTLDLAPFSHGVLMPTGQAAADRDRFLAHARKVGFKSATDGLANKLYRKAPRDGSEPLDEQRRRNV